MLDLGAELAERRHWLRRAAHRWVRRRRESGEAGRVGGQARLLLRRRPHADPDRHRHLLLRLPGRALVRGGAVERAEDAGKGGWGAAAIASGATMGAILFVRMTVRATLAYTIAGSGNDQLTSGLNDLGWVL